MNTGRTVFAQLMDFLPMHTFRGCVQRYRGNYKVRRFSCLDQFLCMAFAQLTYRESLRDIEACLRAVQTKLYHMGIRGKVSRSTVADANENRDWHIYADFAQELIPEPGAFYIMDRGYIDFARLYILTQCSAFFVTRAKTNLKFRRLYSHPVDKATGLRCDQTIVLTGVNTSDDYPEKLRRIRYFDAETSQNLTFLTNNFVLPALTIARLYKCRWQVELFFKWIKQHLRIKSFYGTSESAVKTQIWIAISVYVLVAIVKKRLHLDLSLYTILQILSVTVFEKSTILQVLTEFTCKESKGKSNNQLSLFD